MQKDLFFTYNVGKKDEKPADQKDDIVEQVEKKTQLQWEANAVEGTAVEKSILTQDEKHPADHELEKKLDAIDREDPHPGEKKKLANKVIKTNQKKVSFKGIMLWCAFFWFFIVWWASFILYSMLRNPDQSRTLIPRETGQILLVTFAAVFFGVLFFLGFGLLVINAYRLFTAKTPKKVGYIAGSLMGFVMLVISIGAGIPVISQITGNKSNTNNLLEPYVEMQGGRKYLYSDPEVLLIAPTKLFYQLNENVYKLQVLAWIGAADVQGVSLSCGNGQVLGLENGRFWPCLYTTKKEYPVTMKVVYKDRVSWEQREKTVEIGNLLIASQLTIKASEQTISFNDKQTEMIVWTAPVKLSVDAQQVISDFGLKSNNIQWDTDEDESFDVINTAQRTKNFFTSQLHQIAYRVSDLSPYTYLFDMRVLQPDVPVCQVQIVKKQDTIYSFEVSFLEAETPISEYAYQIKDVEADNIYAEKKSDRNNIEYDFSRAGNYAVKAVFITQAGKKGSCESDNFRVWSVNFSADYSIQARPPQQTAYKDIQDIASMSVSDDVISLTELPTELRFILHEVRPRTEQVDVVVIYDDKTLLTTDQKTYDVNVESPGAHTIVVRVRDKKTGEEQEVKTVQIVVQQEQIVGKIVIKPDTVGIEPFTVKLDASTTTINDPDDEIVYFTRDFGDGDIKKNISQGVVEHTYVFDPKAEEGKYYPTVTITTKKGRTISAKTDNPIIVKKAIRTAKVSFLSHPAQLANVDEPITFAVTTDGVPQKVVWTIGTDVIECPGRQCMEMTRSFSQTGTFDIAVKVSYDDHPDVSDSAKIIIE